MAKEIVGVQYSQHTEYAGYDAFGFVPCENDEVAKNLLFDIRGKWANEHMKEWEEMRVSDISNLEVDIDTETYFKAHFNYHVEEFEAKVVAMTVLEQDRVKMGEIAQKIATASY